MKKNKSLIALILIFALILSNAVAANAHFSDTQDHIYREDISDLYDLGLIQGYEDGSFNPDGMISRAEFCTIVVRLSGLDADEVSATKQYFTDVPPEHPYFNVIGYLASRGVINGFADGTFLPEAYITYDQVNKMIVEFLGYKYLAEANGGYPHGYRATAGRLDLSDGIDLSYDININRGEVCRLVNNALEVPLVEMTGIGNEDGIYEINDDVNILTRYLKLRRIEGFVEANEFYGVNGALAREGCLLIDGISYKMSDEAQSSYVGKNVIVTVTNDDSQKLAEIVTIKEAESNELLLTPEQSIVYESGKIFYDESDTQRKSVSLSPDVHFIHNGEEKTFDGSIINKLQSGNVRLVSREGGRTYDAVIVSEYTSFVVASKSVHSKTLYSEDKKTKLDFSKDIIYNITDSSDKALSFEEIEPGCVLTYFENTSYAEGFVSTYCVSGTLSELSLGGNAYAIINGEEIKLDSATATRVGSFGAGEQVKLYINCFGYAVHAEKIVISTDNIKYFFAIADSSSGGLDNTVRAKFYDINNGIEIFEFSDRVSVNGKGTDVGHAADLKIACPQMVQIELNAENKVSSVTTPQSFASLMEDVGNDGFCEVFAFGDRKFQIDSNSFDNKIVFDRNKTQFMIVPEDMTDYDDDDFRTVNYATFVNGEPYNVAAYNSEKDYEIPDVIVCKMSVSQATNEPLTAAARFFVIDSKSKTVDEDGNECTKLTGYIGSTERFAYIDPNDTIIDEGLNAEDLKEGDVIFCSINSENYLKGFKKVYDKEGGFVQRIEEYKGLDRPIVHISTEAKKTTDSYLYYLSVDPENDYDYTMIKATDNITVVEEKNGKYFVSAGTLQDIEPGDKLIMQVRYTIFVSAIVFK